MVNKGDMKCPICGMLLKPYDSVPRVVRTKSRKTVWVKIRRLRCLKCNQIHRELPDYILPYKQYEAEIIRGVIEGLITTETLGYEDYPCDMTMSRWRSQNLQAM